MNTILESGATAPASGPDVDSVIRLYEERQRRRAELRPTNKTALFDALAAAGITTIVVSFDGYGDSGQIERVEARDATGEISLPNTHVELAIARYDEDDPDRHCLPLDRAIEELAYDALADLHGGWENNEGAYGDFVFDIEKRTISLDYHERYTATEDYSYEL
jgi:hypothetical protein